MSNSVSGPGRGGHMRGGQRNAWRQAEGSLYCPDAQRKYLNRAERERALAAMMELEPERALFALTLAWSGARTQARGMDQLHRTSRS